MATIAIALLKLKDKIHVGQKQVQPVISMMEEALNVGKIDVSIHWFQQIEDPTEIYLISSPSSTSSSSTEECLSFELKKLLESSCQGLYDIVWNHHLDVEYSKLPTSAPVMAIGRHFIRKNCAAQFDAAYNKKKHLAEEFSANRGLAGGWRIDGDNVEGEWVQFSGWDEVAQHRTFPKSEGFQEYSSIRQYVDQVEVRHCVPLASC